jgi:hypothetical protein
MYIAGHNSYSFRMDGAKVPGDTLLRERTPKVKIRTRLRINARGMLR